jgi:hypothetical protein
MSMKTKKPAAVKTASRNKTTAPVKPEIIPVHQWTNGGAEVLILRCCQKDGTSHNGFKWPLQVGATVEAPDWDSEPKCGGGLHGWPWGLSMGDGKEPQWDGAWIVFGADPSQIVDLGGKCKTKRGTVRFVGTWDAAVHFILAGQMAWVHQASSGAASATGYRGAASATGDMGAASATGDMGAASATGTCGAASATGYMGAASATGDMGAASATGDMGAASATGTCGAASATGDRGAASATGTCGAASATGDRGAASATGYRGAASATGTCGAASVTGLNGRAQAGKYGCIALAWWNAPADRGEMRCREVGCGDGSDGKLKSDTWYRLDESGAFVEIPA